MGSHSSMKAERSRYSIVIAVLDGVETLSRCLDSIVSQSNTQWELIVMDGGSNDGSVSVIRDYEDNIAFWESKPDRGIYHAWNKALNHVRGEWICFLGADDYFWNSNVLAEMSSHLAGALSKEIKIVYGQVAKIDDQGNVIKVIGKPWQKIRWLMPHGMPLDLPHPGMMHHRSLFDNHGLFDETFMIAGDYDFLLRELKKGSALFVGGLYTVGSQVGGIADASGPKTHLETARARKKNAIKKFSWVWTAVFIRAFARKLWHNFFRQKYR